MTNGETGYILVELEKVKELQKAVSDLRDTLKASKEVFSIISTREVELAGLVSDANDVFDKVNWAEQSEEAREALYAWRRKMHDYVSLRATWTASTNLGSIDSMDRARGFRSIFEE